jgi:hypothetical protein
LARSIIPSGPLKPRCVVVAFAFVIVLVTRDARLTAIKRAAARLAAFRRVAAVDAVVDAVFRARVGGAAETAVRGGLVRVITVVFRVRGGLMRVGG